MIGGTAPAIAGFVIHDRFSTQDKRWINLEAYSEVIGNFSAQE
jgi:hypothetical protein